jgi:alpha-beta hydrolase superfamily lysophospholipase
MVRVMPACFLACCAHVSPMKKVPVLGANTWQSYDGKEMPWRPADVPEGKPLRAVVITVHGLSGAASDFWMLDDSLPRRGIAVCGMELRGMGNDPDVKHRGDIPSAGVWERDLFTFHQLIRARYPGVPVFWYGESLGSLIALHTQAELMPETGPVPRPAGLIFSSPIAGFKMEPPPWKSFAIHCAMALLPGRMVNLEKLAGVKDKDIRVTAHTTHKARMAVTPHYVPEFSLRLLREIDRKVQTNRSALLCVRQPLLVLATPNDVISTRAQVQRFFDIVPSADKTIHWFERSYHLILHDVQRDEALRVVTAWLEARMAGKSVAPSLAAR